MGKVTTDEKERLLKGSLTTKQVGIPTKARAGLFTNRVAQFWMASVGFTNGGLVRLIE